MRTLRQGAALIAVTVAASACGSTSAPRPARTAAPAPAPAATASATATAPKIAIQPQDQPACSALFARLQRVSLALGSSSSLIAQSENAADLGQRIATQQQQLERSARLMDSAVVPDPLAATNRRLVTALRTFARDFSRARAPARRGDFAAAVDAMTDRPAVNRILAAATTIQDACSA